MASANPPKLTTEQREAALEQARIARLKRAQIKDDFKIGKVSLAELLDSDDKVVKRMRVLSLIKSLPSIGEVKAKRIMAECAIGETRRIGGLGKHQKAALLAHFA